MCCLAALLVRLGLMATNLIVSWAITAVVTGSRRSDGLPTYSAIAADPGWLGYCCQVAAWIATAIMALDVGKVGRHCSV